MNQFRTVKRGTIRVRRHNSRLRNLVIGLQIAVLLSFGVGIGLVSGTIFSVSRELKNKVGNGYSPPEAMRIYSSDNVLLATVGQENRQFVDLDQIPLNLRNATIAIEDSRFREHGGVDFKGIARAMFKNVLGHDLREGGSTITQQLARNIYLSPKKTVSRKIREAILAVLIERNYTKDRILELYLNQVYYGSTSFGVEAASEIYFGKPVNRLDLAECALIAGLPKSPSTLSPHDNLVGATNRRDTVLNRMAELHYISQEECDKAKAEVPRIVPFKAAQYRSKAPYFTDYVKRYVRDHYNFTDDLIYRGGLRVYTTVNYEMQAAAQAAVTSGIEQARKSGQMNRAQGQGALVCIDPNTGYIRAMVGGTDYGTGRGQSVFNRAVQSKRQPGSSFKLFVYTTAVDMLGWDADHIVEGGHYYHHVAGGPTWAPKNFDDKWWGNMPMRRAVAQSVNIPAIKTAEKVGLNNVINYAHMMGIKSEIEPYPALAIGGIGGIDVLEMCSAYSVIASGGTYFEPTPIAKITDSQGQTIEAGNGSDRGKKILQDKTVKVMDELFRGVVMSHGGTGYAVRSVPEARGKTGTTNNDVDAWFIGYVPGKLVTAVWAGNDNHTGMRNVWGGNVCAPIWKDFMTKALKVYSQTHETKPVTETKPETKPAVAPTDQDNPTAATKPEVHTDPNTGVTTVRVKICDDSALIANSACPHWHYDTYSQGTEPKQVCNIHGKHKKKKQQQPDNNDQTTNNTDDGLRLTPPPDMTDH